MDIRQRVGDIAEGYMRSRFRVERGEIVGEVLEAIVLEILEADPRFHGSAKGLFWELSANREERELVRQRKNEEAAAAAEPGSPPPERLPAGPGRYVPVGAPPPPLELEEEGIA